MKSSPPLSILVVDGVADSLSALCALLQAANPGVRVLGAGSAAAALDLLHGEDLGLVLLDVPDSGSGMDAYSLAEQMRAGHRARPVPLLFLSSVAPDAQRGFAGCENGAVDYLYKPLNTHVLQSKVQVFMELHRQRQQLAARLGELERAARLNALMIGALSHDIRTPLAALQLNAELVSRRSDNPGLQQAGLRLKAATAMLGRQVDHLVNLATAPTGDVQPTRQPVDLAALLATRIEAARASDLRVDAHGDVQAMLDPALMSGALDQLLMLALAHADGQPASAEVDGDSRRVLVLRLHLQAVLPESVHDYLFGGGSPVPGLAAARVGPGLDAAERMARVHGGSLIGRTRGREGTLFEMVLPRDSG